MIASGTSTISREYVYPEDDRHEAAILFHQAFGFWPEYVCEDEEDGQAFELAGVCEGCGRPIFEDEKFKRWEEGIVTHKGKCPARKES